MQRIRLRHAPPPFVPAGGWFFLTLCCARRGTDQLCRAETSRALLEAALFYHERREWVVHLFLLMPDHLHGIVAFPRDASPAVITGAWKRFTARTAGIVWQRNFFDHRLRSVESLQEKAAYIRQNPVRAGMVARPADWPHFIDFGTMEDR